MKTHKPLSGLKNVLATTLLSTGLLMTAGAVTAPAAFAQATEYPKTHLRLGHFLPATFAGADVDQWFAEEIGRRSNGAVDVEIFWAGSMGGADELLSLVSSGALDMAAFPYGYYPQQFPLTGVGTLPNTFLSADEIFRDFSRILALPEVRAEHEKNGVRMLTSHFSNPYRIACNSTMATIDDLKGYRVRSAGDYLHPVYESIGMIPVSAASSEVYENLDRGVMQCTYLSYDMMVASRIYEVAKFTSDINLGSVATWQIWGNQNKLNSMPESVRNLILDVADEAMKRDMEQAQAADKESLQILIDKGVTLQELQPAGVYEERVPSMVDFWMTRMTAQGLEEPANKILPLIK